jgi:D-aminopeptidase
MLLVLAILMAAAQPAAKGWTFCIAEAGDDIYVTEVFEAALDREKLEVIYAVRLRASGVAHADVQCPAPLSERTDAVNAQFTAISFQRTLLRRLHMEPPLSLKR